MEEFCKSNCSLMSDDVRELGKALIKARLKMEKVIKGAKGNFGKYADINAIYDSCIEPLYQEGIFIWHGSDQIEGGKEILHTRLVHAASGQWMSDKRILIIDNHSSKGSSNQGRGSANTYARKLALLSLCALGCEDDDCDIPSKKVPISALDASRINTELKKSPNADSVLDVIKKHYNISSLVELYQHEAKDVMAYIAKYREIDDNK